MSSCAVVEYDPKRVEPISGLHTLAGYCQSYLWGPSRAVWDTSSQSMEREFGVRIKPAESFYGSLAKTFLEMPTTLRQMLRRTFWCLRVLPQVSRRLLWRLRVLPQERFSSFWRLQDCCKHFQRHFGRYNMLSETFSMNKGISFFCRTHIMDSIGTLA